LAISCLLGPQAARSNAGMSIIRVLVFIFIRF
jgi:hypothetical protein